MTDEPLQPIPAHVTRVVGTPEFIEAWKALEVVVQAAMPSQSKARRILEVAELACRQAYLDGFNEGLCK